MFSDGSIDSMEKSTYTSSIEDNNSYEGFDSNNPNPTTFKYTNNDHQKDNQHTYMQPYRQVLYNSTANLNYDIFIYLIQKTLQVYNICNNQNTAFINNIFIIFK